MKKWIGRVMLAGLVVLAMAGCGKKEQTADTSGQSGEAKLKAVLVTSTGGLGDRSFLDSTWAGLQQAHDELGVDIAVIEPKTNADYGSSMVAAVNGGANIIFAFGNDFTDVLNEYAPKFPDVKFVGLNCKAKADNLKVAQTADHEGSFLAGALAGMMTKTGTVGAIGGVEGDNINRFLVGYEEGVKYVNPDAIVLKSYVGSFSDPAKGKEFAIQLKNQNADIIYHVAGGTGEGVFEAVRMNEGLFAIGVDADQDGIVEGRVLTSMVKNCNVIAYDSVKQALEGKFIAGDEVYNLANGGVGLTEMKYTKDLIGEENLKKLDEIKAKIESGEIKVTDVLAQ